jgi:hypothetical protein
VEERFYEAFDELVINLRVDGAYIERICSISNDSVTIGYSSFSGAYGPLWIAVEEQLGRKYGLELKTIYAGRVRPQQLLASGSEGFSRADLLRPFTRTESPLERAIRIEPRILYKIESMATILKTIMESEVDSC